MKTTFLKLWTGVGFALAVAGCSTAPDADRGPVRQRAPIPNASTTEAPDLGSIEGFSIPPRQCGMILYTGSGASPVPIFRSVDDGTALIHVEGSMTRLSLVGRGGETRMSIPANQFFRGRTLEGMDITVAASTQWGTPFPSGSYVQRGTLTVTAADGWSRVIPVAGIAGCRV